MSNPNIVFIMTDQQRADFTKAEGFAVDTMPALDAFARSSGYRFRRAYTPSPLCTPARCSLFTGRYPKATGVKDNYRSGREMRKTAPDLFEVLKQRGYSINLCGKNHSYLRREECRYWSEYTHHGYAGPKPISGEAKEFDGWLKAHGNRIDEAPCPFRATVQQPARIVDDAIECVAAVRDSPFFLWISFPEPHNPSQVSEPYFSMFDEDRLPPVAATGDEAEAKGGKWKWMKEAQELWQAGIEGRAERFRSTYAGMLRLIDDQISRFLEFLRRDDMLSDMVLVFLSDHGDYAFEYGLHGKGVGMPECLVRVPLVIWAPGVVSPAVNEEDFVSLVDLMPTVCDALNVEIPPGVQGRSLWPILTGGAYPRREFASVYSEVGIGDRYFEPVDPADPPLHFDLRGAFFDGLNCVSMSGKQKMVRKGDWKLHFDMMGQGELYDLKEDPMELHNLYADPEYEKTKSDLMAELLMWTIRTEDDLPKGLYERNRHPKNWYWGADAR